MKSSARILIAAAVVAAALGAGALGATGDASGGGREAAGLATGVPDGDYVARAKARVPFGKIAFLPWVKLRVVVARGRIDRIDVLAPSAFIKAEDFMRLGERIVAAQDTEVEAASGATYTSAAYKAAVRKALGE